MKNRLNIYILILATAYSVTSGFGQITTSPTSLPNPGDALSYKTLTGLSQNYLLSGENVVWDFSDFEGEFLEEEIYNEASIGSNFNQFPETDILLTFAGAEAYANRNSTNIEIVGIAGAQFFEGLDLAQAQALSSPYVIRRAPMSYGDTYTNSSTIGFSVPTSAFGPLADVFNEFSPVEGATVDSVRINLTLNRTEEVDSYGTVLFGDDSIDALRLVQEDETAIGIEIYVSSPFLEFWADISAFIDPSQFGFENQTITNYIFLDENSKEFIAEINIDSLTEFETGRYNSDFTNSIEESSAFVFSLYPNPVNETLYIEGVKMSEIEVLNDLGQVVFQKTIQGRIQESIPMENFPAGIYLVKAYLNSGEVLTSPFIKN